MGRDHEIVETATYLGQLEFLFSTTVILGNCVCVVILVILSAWMEMLNRSYKFYKTVKVCVKQRISSFIPYCLCHSK